jgi:hypothetical protein
MKDRQTGKSHVSSNPVSILALENDPMAIDVRGRAALGSLEDALGSVYSVTEDSLGRGR